MGDYFLQQVVNALSADSLYALMAVGLAMVFGILRLINFAHGDLMMIAAYIAAFALGAGLSLPIAIPIMVGGTVLVALLMERVAYRPIRGAPDVAMLLSSFAVGQILQNGTLLTTRLAGKPQQIAFPSPDGLGGVTTIGSITISQVNIISFVAGTILLGLLTVFVTRTRLGLSMRAAAEDLVAAQARRTGPRSRQPSHGCSASPRSGAGPPRSRRRSRRCPAQTRSRRPSNVSQPCRSLASEGWKNVDDQGLSSVRKERVGFGQCARAVPSRDQV